MKIESKISKPFKAEILDELQNKPAVKNDLKKYFKKKAEQLLEETLSEMVKLRNFFNNDEIEISVSVGIGDPEENEEDND